MTITTAKINNDTLALPKGLRPRWSDAEVAIRGDADTLIITKRAGSSLATLSPLGKRLKAAGKRVSARAIAAEIQSVRRARR